MEKKLRRLPLAAVGLFLLLAVGYILQMAWLDGTTVLDDPSFVRVDAETEAVALSWYARAVLGDLERMEGVDAAGNRYTWFSCELPEIYESAELDGVVAWSGPRVRVYIGESRGMDVIQRDYPQIEWSGRFQ